MSTIAPPSLALQAFPARLHELLLAARPSLFAAPTVPVCGSTYDLLLLRGDRILSAPCEQKTKITGLTLSEAFGIDDEAAARVRRYLCVPDRDFFAVALPNADRLLLVAPVPGLAGGQGVAFLLRTNASISTAGVARVLCYSFDGRVAVDEATRRRAETPMRKCDEDTYVYLERLFRLWRQLVGGTAGNDGVHIEDRRVLSYQLRMTGKRMLALLGLSPDAVGTDTFPIPYPFCGSYHPARAAWMLLCLWCGLRRCLAGTLPDVREIVDNERLLPMLELRAGNRSPLPTEWEECRALAARYGMLFEVKRTKSAIRVCLCPMTPDIAPSLFYELCAPASLLWQLRAISETAFTPAALTAADHAAPQSHSFTNFFPKP